MGFPGELVLKNMPANAGDIRKRGLSPWVGKIPWRRERIPIPVLWPGEFHGLTGVAKSRTRLSDFQFTMGLNAPVPQAPQVQCSQRLRLRAPEGPVFPFTPNFP